MSLTYHLVQRPDKSEGALEGSKLYYGQIKIRQQVDFDTLCERIADRSTASKGDVMVVIDQAGNSVQMGEFGNFRLSVGSSGVANAEDFNTSLFKKGKIIFTPGSRLRTMSASPKFERIEFKPAE